MTTHQRRARKQQKQADDAAESSKEHRRELGEMQDQAHDAADRVTQTRERLTGMAFDLEAVQAAKEMGVRFLMTELETGHTLAAVALRALDAETAARNRQKARTAYDAVLRFIRRVSMTDKQSREINAKIASLKARLEQLGESF